MTKLDPRFIRMKKKATKVVVDKRFQEMFEEDGEFVRPVSVDKYGRPVAADHHKKELQHFYRLEDEDGEEGMKLGQRKFIKSKKMDDSDVSSSESNTDDDSETAEEDYVMDDTLSSHPLVVKDVPIGEATRRLAVVNLDWDQLKADDIFTALHAFKPPQGSILAVTIYPSKFGLERMEREHLEGPPKELFNGDTNNSSNNNEEAYKSQMTNSDNEEEEGESGIALRKYQLERLRYYYAVVECDDVATARHLYHQCDGSEFEKSANFIDLRFIPDDVQFDDAPPRDSCTALPSHYDPKPDIITGALQSTRVTLTWDDDDADRRRIITGRRPKGETLEEADLRAYLASSSSDEDAAADDDKGDLNNTDMKKQQQAEKYRKLLLEGSSTDDVFGRKDDRGGELSITFASALREDALDRQSEEEDVHMEVTFNDKDETKSKQSMEDMTPFQKYMERRKVKKEARREALRQLKEKEAEEERKKTKKKRRHDDTPYTQEELAKLSAIMGIPTNQDDEDNQSRRGRRQSKREMDSNVDVQDDRFRAIYEEAAYALDPSHPSFKRTKGTEKIIKERQRRRYNQSVNPST